MSSLLGCLLELATGFVGSLMTMASSNSLDCASTSVSWASSVYWSNSPLNEAVVSSTTLAGCGGGHMTCFVAECFAASFHVILWVVFSNCHLANGLMTSVMHSEMRPAFLLSQWRTVISSSIPLFHLGHAVGALNCIQPSLLFGILYWCSVSISYVPGALNISQNRILEAWAMPFGVTFQYHNQKSTSSRFSILSGSCLTAGGHTASFINQVCIILVNSFVIPDSIMNGVGGEAWVCAFSCFRACNIIVCSSGVWSLPFFALATSRVSLNSGLSREHVCCHLFLLACVFLSGLANTPVTEIGGSPFPHGGVILDVGRLTKGTVVCNPTACDDDDACCDNR